MIDLVQKLAYKKEHVWISHYDRACMSNLSSHMAIYIVKVQSIWIIWTLFDNKFTIHSCFKKKKVKACSLFSFFF